jgi:hypothetical protein
VLLVSVIIPRLVLFSLCIWQPPTLHHAATQHLVELGPDEAAMCVATATFHDKGTEVFLIVGTVVGLRYHPRSHRGGFLHTYRFMQVCSCGACLTSEICF